jgi:hypothetical protein
MTDYLLLKTFRSLFEGNKYNHRDSSLGDKVACCLYDDLFHLDKSATLRERVKEHQRVVNAQNVTVGVFRRRGDGTFGEVVPGVAAVLEPGFVVARGKIATVEIGAETKILAKAMIKQIDRVIGDLNRQLEEFRRGGGKPICVGFVGVNFSEQYTSYEGDRAFPTDGKKYKHPIQEAEDALARVKQRAASNYDEFLFLLFAATNMHPFPFRWVNEQQTTLEYSALLTRVSREYDRRFR